jgi:hypothetical protein
MWKCVCQYLQASIKSNLTLNTHILMVKVSCMVMGRGGKDNANTSLGRRELEYCEENHQLPQLGRIWCVHKFLHGRVMGPQYLLYMPIISHVRLKWSALYCFL